MQVDNRKVMGEALKEIRRRLIAPYLTEDQFRQFSPNKPLVDIIDSALAKEPRNCDVGTAEEQAQRMEKFCNSHGHGFDGQKCYSCENCKLISVDWCELAWAQMPYNEGEESDE